MSIAAEAEPLLAILERLVNIDSGSYCVDGVNAAGTVLCDLWSGLGFSAERHPLDGFGDRIALSRRFSGRVRVLIVGHLDTVWPHGTCAAWPFRIEHGIAHGPGVGDMKGGLVMAYAAVAALIAAGFDGVGEIRHILVPDEELGSALSRGWIEAEARQADWVLVLEPARGNGAVVVGRGAVGAIIVRATGISAHTIGVGEAASAVRALADKVAPLEALTDLGRGIIVSVGILRGGDARQVVPAACEMHVDLRARTDADAAALLAQVLDILRTGADPRVAIEISGGITRPAFPAKASADLYARAAQSAQALGIDYPAVESGGGSDGSFAAALGRPTLDGLGPVCFESCSLRERIVVDSLFDRAAIMAGLIADLADGSAPHRTADEVRPWA